jgi:glycosyltransferase involved in cell wall biosynthesis
LGCVIPAFNAAATVGAVAAGLRYVFPECVVIGVDDGSRDGTSAVLAGCCDRALATADNEGKGAALRRGFGAALTLGCDAILTIDADGQHDPLYAPQLVAALAAADLVIGTRAIRTTAMPVGRRVTNALSVAATRRLVGAELGDVQSGYRAMRADLVRAIDARGDRYEFETDFLLRALRGGFRVASVSVPTLYGPPSHFREIRDGFRVVATFWRHAWTGA